MKEKRRGEENDKWKRVTKDKRDKRRKGMGEGRVDEENNVHYPAL